MLTNKSKKDQCKLQELQDLRDNALNGEARRAAQDKIDNFFLSAKMPRRKRPGEKRDDRKRKTKKDRKFIYGI